MIVPFADRVWIANTNQSMLGLEVGARMTVIDLDGHGQLLIHSPIRLTPELKKQIDALGSVSFVVSPNLFHHLYVGDFRKQYPSAKIYCAPGLERKRKDIQFEGVVTTDHSFPWNPNLAHHVMKGISKLNEVVFFHPHSKTLILTDVALHVCHSPSLFTRIVFKAIGAYGKFGWAKAEKFLFIDDKPAFQNSIKEILSWDFDKVLMCHGEPLQTHGKDRLKQAFLDS